MDTLHVRAETRSDGPGPPAEGRQTVDRCSRNGSGSREPSLPVIFPWPGLHHPRPSSFALNAPSQPEGRLQSRFGRRPTKDRESRPRHHSRHPVLQPRVCLGATVPSCASFCRFGDQHPGMGKCRRVDVGGQRAGREGAGAVHKAGRGLRNPQVSARWRSPWRGSFRYWGVHELLVGHRPHQRIGGIVGATHPAWIVTAATRAMPITTVRRIPMKHLTLLPTYIVWPPDAACADRVQASRAECSKTTPRPIDGGTVAALPNGAADPRNELVPGWGHCGNTTSHRR